MIKHGHYVNGCWVPASSGQDTAGSVPPRGRSLTEADLERRLESFGEGISAGFRPTIERVETLERENGILRQVVSQVSQLLAQPAPPSQAARGPRSAEDASNYSDPGWLGLVRLETLDSYLDWGAHPKPGTPVKPVSAEARASGIRNGDLLVAVSGCFDWDSWHAQSERPRAGEKVIVTVRRDGVEIDYSLRLALEPPRPAERKTKPKVQRPAIPCGPLVEKIEQRRYRREINTHPRLQPLDKAVMHLILDNYFSYERGAFPHFKTIGARMRRSGRQVQRSIDRLRTEGLLVVRSGRKVGRANNYTPTWPGTPGANVVRFTAAEGGKDAS